jgi:hypothetical protein
MKKILNTCICTGLKISHETCLISDSDWLGWQARSLLNLQPPNRRNQVARVFRSNPATCYRSVKLKFVVEWIQKIPAKIIISLPGKVQDFEGPGFMFSINFD